LIPVLAIPISLIGSFFIMYVAGFSINILTLLAIVLATGIVVDDAIVVLENIYSKIEGGMPPMQAGHRRVSKEITFAIISTTVTLAAVFLPIVFLSGFTGRLFREFGVVVAGSVLISAVVSLTLTPMLSARWLKHKPQAQPLLRLDRGLLQPAHRRLRPHAGKFLQRRWLALPIMGACIAAIWAIGTALPSELAPNEDKSRFMMMSTARKAPASTRWTRTSRTSSSWWTP
jgi:multidrug efflux pump